MSRRGLNAPRASGNKGAVNREALLAAALALAIVGCGAPPRAPAAPGETQILLENTVPAPCEVVWASARVDDHVLERATIAPPGSPPASLDRQVLKPGEHTIAIAATASCGGAEPTAVLQLSTPVYIGKDGGSITITLARDAAAVSGLSARFAVSGGEVLAPRADGGEVDCRKRMPVDHAICRTEEALARARRDRDVVRVLCVGEKLREMRLLTDTVAQGAPLPGVPGEALGDIEADTTLRVLTLAKEADLCVGQQMMGAEGTSTQLEQVRKQRAFF